MFFNQTLLGYFLWIKVVRQRCDSDATSDEIVAMLKRYYCEIITFLSRRYYRF